MDGVHDVLSRLAWPVVQRCNGSLIVESYECRSSMRVSAEQVYSQEYTH